MRDLSIRSPLICKLSLTHPLPTFADVCRCVELRQNSDTADQSIIDDLPDHLGRVDLGWLIATILDEFGPRSADIGEAVGIGDVPVERVQLGHGHAVDRSQDRLFVDIVSTGVQKDPAIGIPWTVHDVHLIGYLNLIAQIIEDDQLTESLYGMSSSEVRVRRDVGFYLKFILVSFNCGYIY